MREKVSGAVTVVQAMNLVQTRPKRVVMTSGSLLDLGLCPGAALAVEIDTSSSSSSSSSSPSSSSSSSSAVTERDAVRSLALAAARTRRKEEKEQRAKVGMRFAEDRAEQRERDAVGLLLRPSFSSPLLLLFFSCASYLTFATVHRIP